MVGIMGGIIIMRVGLVSQAWFPSPFPLLWGFIGGCCICCLSYLCPWKYREDGRWGWIDLDIPGGTVRIVILEGGDRNCR